MKELLAWLQQPENVAALVAIAVAISGAIRVIGEVFLAIGKLNKQPDKWDSVGAALCNLSAKLGKFLTWIGFGNKK